MCGLDVTDQALGDPISEDPGSVREACDEDPFAGEEGHTTLGLELGADPADLLDDGVDCFGVHGSQ